MMNGKSILIFAIVALVVFLLGYVIDRWLNPWLVKRLAEKVVRDIKEGKHQKPRNYDFEITFDLNGISVLPLKDKSFKAASISWMKIKRVTAFKRDLFTVDCICLLFETADEMTLEINEDMKGWPEFSGALDKYLPGCKPLAGWLFQVATPAFATNPTEIFLKS
jgi:hypothetical protein